MVSATIFDLKEQFPKYPPFSSKSFPEILELGLERNITLSTFVHARVQKELLKPPLVLQISWKPLISGRNLKNFMESVFVSYPIKYFTISWNTYFLELR